MKQYLKDRVILFRKPAYSRYFVAAIMATIASGFVYIANTWLVVSLDHPLKMVVWSFIAFWLPKAILSPFAGAIIDRLDRKLVTAGGIVILGISYAIFALMINLYPAINIYWIYAYYTYLGVFNSFFLPSLIAFIREIVGNEQLLYANANLDVGYQVGNITGIGLAGYLIHFLGFSGGYSVAAILFLISAILIYSIADKYRNKVKIKPRQTNVISQCLIDIKQAYNYVRGNQPRIVLYFTQLFLMLIIMTTPVLLGPFAKTELNANAIQFGHIEIMMTIGTILGGFILIYLARIHNFIITLLLSIVLLVVSLLIFSTVHSIFAAQLLYGLMGFSLGTWSILMSRAQELTDPKYQGRVQSLFGSLTAVFVIALYLGVSLLTDFITIRHVYWVVALMALIPLYAIIRYPKYFR